MSAIDLAGHGETLATLNGYIDGVPAARSALDHVQATSETVLGRALWLREHYDLAETRVVLLGDHDLTSLAILLVCPRARVTVVDLDDRVLEYVDRLSAGGIATVHADLRVSLPPALAASADLVFSDPPYTPEGMGLFAARGIECLAERTSGRVVLAYGYSSRHPTLGLKVQRALAGLGLLFEAIIPGFNTYTGAPAIGSSADLYVCRPTTGAPKTRWHPVGIYTRGPNATESRPTPRTLLDSLHALAAGDGAFAVDLRDAGWAKPVNGGDDTAVAVDLSADPGPMLMRVLLATNAARVAILLPNAHPDLANERAQTSLMTSLRDKYRLRLLRSRPDDAHAVVLADAVPARLADPVVGAVLARAHGKVANTWRDALVSASGGELTKNAARDIVGEHPAGILEHRLIDLPRHRIDELITALLSRSECRVSGFSRPGKWDG